MTLPLKNINDLPPSTRPWIVEFSNKFLSLLGDNLRCILVFGSAASIDYRLGISNINTAIVLKQLDFNVLNHSLPLVQWGRKHKIATPLFLTKDYICESLDVFPIEFSEIKHRHKLIYGEDIFKDLEIPSKDLRLFCEQQIKGKLLHLRQAYLGIGAKPWALKNVLLSALNDLMPIFRQLIILKGQNPGESKEAMLEQLANIFSLDLQPFLATLHDKHRMALIASGHVEAHLENFLRQMESLSRHMDSL